MFYDVPDFHWPALVNRWQVPLYLIELGAQGKRPAFFPVAVRLAAAAGVAAPDARVATTTMMVLIGLLTGHGVMPLVCVGGSSGFADAVYWPFRTDIKPFTRGAKSW